MVLEEFEILEKSIRSWTYGIVNSQKITYELIQYVHPPLLLKKTNDGVEPRS